MNCYYYDKENNELFEIKFLPRQVDEEMTPHMKEGRVVYSYRPKTVYRFCLCKMTNFLHIKYSNENLQNLLDRIDKHVNFIKIFTRKDTTNYLIF